MNDTWKWFSFIINIQQSNHNARVYTDIYFMCIMNVELVNKWIYSRRLSEKKKRKHKKLIFG